VFRGGGEMASAAARLCFLAGFRVVVLEQEWPLAVRRRVCFAEAVLSGSVDVEGARGQKVLLERLSAAPPGFVEVAVDPEGRALRLLRPDVLVDGRMAKRASDTRRDQAPLVIGLGPGFEAGRDVHAVVETQRGAWLGRVIRSGSAEADTRVPSAVLGVTAARVLRAPRAGAFRSRRAIGDILQADDGVGEVDGVPVVAGVGGLLRGLVADGVPLREGAKLGDIDPRGPAIDPAAISDKARAVAAGVLEAVLMAALRA
jgi:xanthine dehydrogenase accessory factor